MTATAYNRAATMRCFSLLGLETTQLILGLDGLAV